MFQLPCDLLNITPTGAVLATKYNSAYLSLANEPQCRLCRGTRAHSARSLLPQRRLRAVRAVREQLEVLQHQLYKPPCWICSIC